MKVICRNLMEDVVQAKLEEVVGQLNCCTCDRCRLDIFSYILNRVPPKYVASTEGEILSSVGAMCVQPSADVMTYMFEAAEVVRKNPRHQMNVSPEEGKPEA